MSVHTGQAFTSVVSGGSGSFVLKAGDTMTGALQFSGATNPGLILNSLTITQRDALTPVNGMLINNSTLNQFNKYENGQWVDVSKSPATKVVAPAGSGFAADYYAPGDTTGVLDAVAIQSALNDVHTLGGGSVYIKAGTYYVFTSLQVYDNTHVYGDGPATYIKYINTTLSTSSILLENQDQVNGNTRIILSDFMVDGNNSNVTVRTPGVNQIYLHLSTLCEVRDITVINAPHAAIVLDSSNDCIVTNNYVDGAIDIGIYVSNSLYNIVLGNKATNTGSYGIRAVSQGGGSGNQNIIEGNYVYNCGQTSNVDGITVETNAEQNLVVGNTVFLSGRCGILITGSAYCSVTGNYVGENDREGILIQTVGRGQVTGNTAHANSRQTNNTYAGIRISNAQNVTVTGNRSGDTGAGTRQKYGILEDGTSDYNIITGNMLDRNGTANLSVVGANTQLGHNVTAISGSPSESHSGFTSTSPIILLAGTASASTAPLKFTSGTNLTTPEDGAIEYDGSHLYIDIGSTRYQLDQQSVLAGDVVGPASATDHGIARFDGTTGKLVEDSGVIIDDSNNITAGTWAATTIAINKGGTGQVTASAAFDAISPMTTLGDIIYGGTSGTNTRLAGQITSTRNFLRQTGTGSASAAPAWDTVTKTDVGLSSVENTALSTWAGSTNITTLGTITSGTWTGTTIAVANGGTGQTTYTNGQLLIGNTTGNTLAKATLTGTANQVVVTNGSGSITLSTPQDIATGSSPTFAGLTLNGAELITSASATAFQVGGTGATNPAFTIDASAASAVTGLTLTVKALAGGVVLQPSSSGSNEDFFIKSKGSSAVKIVPGSNSTSSGFQLLQADGTTTYFRADSTNKRVRIGDATAPTGTLDIVGKFVVNSSGLAVNYNNIATVSNGIPSELATIDSTGLTANVTASTLYAVPASGAGMYRVSTYVVETTAASVSSTLPNVQIVYTDNDTAGSITMDATPILGVAGIGQTGALTANTVGTASSGVIAVYVKASTTIQYQTVNYASSLAGMAYSLRIKLEAL